jgi:hypothetical protein
MLGAAGIGSISSLVILLEWGQRTGDAESSIRTNRQRTLLGGFLTGITNWADVVRYTVAVNAAGKSSRWNGVSLDALHAMMPGATLQVSMGRL